MESPDLTITQAVRSLRPVEGAGTIPTPTPVLPALPSPLPPAIPAPASIPDAPPPPPSASGSGSSGSSQTSGSGTASSASQASSAGIQPLRRRTTPPPAARPAARGPQQQSSAPQDDEWSMQKWLPLLVAATTFAAVFSAGPLLAPGRFLREDGRPDKLKWALAAGGTASVVLVGVYAARSFA